MTSTTTTDNPHGIAPPNNWDDWSVGTGHAAFYMSATGSTFDWFGFYSDDDDACPTRPAEGF